MKKVAVIVAAYNPEKYLKVLFRSLCALNYPKDDFKVFVIDDNPDSVIKDKVLEVRGDLNLEVIENKKNLGFAGTNNVGMRRALKERYSARGGPTPEAGRQPSGWEYVVLLNQDMEVDENWLSELVKKAESDENVGIVQAMMLFMQDKKVIQSSGEKLACIGIGYASNHKTKLVDYQPQKDKISYACGAAILFKRGVLEEIGLFDESFFMYHEDTDLSWRGRMAGYKIVLARESICYHDYSFEGRSKMVFYWTEKNRLMFLLKNFELKTLILIFPIYLVTDIGMIGYALLTGWFWKKIKSYIWFFKNLGKILKKRREIQAKRKVRDRELKKYLVAGVEFGGLENFLLKYVANPVLKLYWRVIKRFI